MGLLPASDQRLLELAAQGFSAEQAQEAGAFGKAPKPLGIGRAQPLKIDGQLRRIEILACGRRGKRMRRQVRRRDAHLRARPRRRSVRSHPSGDQTIFWIAVSRPKTQRPRLGSGLPHR